MAENKTLKILTRVVTIIAMAATIYRLFSSWSQITHDPHIDDGQL